MKNVMIMLGIILVGLTGCEKSEKKTIVGKWKEVDGTRIIEFFKGGTVTVTDKGEPPLTGDYKFIDETRIRMDLKGLGELLGPVIAEISASKTEISLVAPDGELETYWKQGAPINKTAANEKITKFAIEGKYALFIKNGEDEFRTPAVTIFRNDGTVAVNFSGKWQIDGDQLECYKIPKDTGHIQKTVFVKGQIVDNTVRCSYGIFVKQEGAVIVKTLEAPALILWSNYSLSGNKSDQPKLAILELKKDSTCVEFLLTRDVWRIKNGLVEITRDNKKHKGRIEGNVIVFKEDGVEFSYVKQNGRSPGAKSETKSEQEIKSKTFWDLVEEDDKRLRAEPRFKVKFKELSSENKEKTEKLFEK